MPIYTSYFAKASKEPNAVSIARKPPYWFKGEQYLALAPPDGLLNAWNAGKVTPEEYTTFYSAEVLCQLDPEKVYSDLDGKILLCWEASDKFCHRHLVASWLADELDIEVSELSVI